MSLPLFLRTAPLRVSRRAPRLPARWGLAPLAATLLLGAAAGECPRTGEMGACAAASAVRGTLAGISPATAVAAALLAAVAAVAVLAALPGRAEARDAHVLCCSSRRIPARRVEGPRGYPCLVHDFAAPRRLPGTWGIDEHGVWIAREDGVFRVTPWPPPRDGTGSLLVRSSGFSDGTPGAQLARTACLRLQGPPPPDGPH